MGHCCSTTASYGLAYAVDRSYRATRWEGTRFRWETRARNATENLGTVAFPLFRKPLMLFTSGAPVGTANPNNSLAEFHLCWLSCLQATCKRAKFGSDYRHQFVWL